ncbi:DNA repair protein [Vibrio sp. 10N.286.49.B3]|uniref:DUF2802 domain-containing protein n=1 Tax=Vibrio sp. 10N.286.49.B3 TaxID=1880855 RepID=UPI000C83B2BB|nr:DUF2802 domain-containing protein [Vibrio sp. 10N.286.49.B3]PMH41017.1 DNA repair protein [Vibrio sp. 10N.286.49.B3]
MVDSLFALMPWLVSGAVFGVVIIFILMLKINSALKKQQAQLRQQLRHAEKEWQKGNQQLLEVRSVVVGLGQRINDQQGVMNHLTERIVELENSDNDGRLYTRATKMVQLGAGLNELIEECELPKAEAELMMSLQNKIAGKETVPPLSGHFDAQRNEARSRYRPTRARKE